MESNVVLGKDVILNYNIWLISPFCSTFIVFQSFSFVVLVGIIWSLVWFASRFSWNTHNAARKVAFGCFSIVTELCGCDSIVRSFNLQILDSDRRLLNDWDWKGRLYWQGAAFYVKYEWLALGFLTRMCFHAVFGCAFGNMGWVICIILSEDTKYGQVQLTNDTIWHFKKIKLYIIFCQLF